MIEYEADIDNRENRYPIYAYTWTSKYRIIIQYILNTRGRVLYRARIDEITAVYRFRSGGHIFYRPKCRVLYRFLYMNPIET